jgi:hypothetical protein
MSGTCTLLKAAARPAKVGCLCITLKLQTTMPTTKDSLLFLPSTKLEMKQMSKPRSMENPNDKHTRKNKEVNLLPANQLVEI